MNTELWHDDFTACGYKPYRDTLKDVPEKHVPVDKRMYQGSQQKRVRDARGTRYFLNVDLWQWPNGNRGISGHVQFSVKDEHNKTCDVTLTIDDIPSFEAFFFDLWSSQKWGYYEVDDATVLPQHGHNR